VLRGRFLRRRLRELKGCKKGCVKCLTGDDDNFVFNALEIAVVYLEAGHGGSMVLFNLREILIDHL
jgi:hypothetical protein